jgi:hypothetical protein
LHAVASGDLLLSPEELNKIKGGFIMVDDSGMSDTSVTTEGPLSQLGSSIKGVLIGLLCFIAAFPVLYCGATRVMWNKVFKEAVPVEQAKSGKPAYVTGIATAEKIGDPPNVAVGDYLRISKTPEVYAWVEHVKEESTKERSGVASKKTTTTKTYSYALEWTSDPKPITNFKSDKWQTFCQNNRLNPSVLNPTLEEKSTSIYAGNCQVKGYAVDVKAVEFYSGSRDMGSKYVKGVQGAPKLGDKRINYTAQPSGVEYTFAGGVSGKSIVKFESGKETKLAGGTGSFDALIQSLKSEDKMKGILFFFGGFILMAIGLNGMAGPITTLLEFIPFLGDLGAGAIRVVLTIIALVISALIYWLIKLWFLWLILIIAGVIAVIVVRKMKKPATA